VNRVYTVYWSAEAASGSWTNLPSQTDVPGSGGVDTLAVPMPGVARGFFRMGVRTP
jgi:hypothetical protein